jgi:hypothetical protein
MRFYLTGFFCVVVLFISCVDNTRYVPPELIQEHAMAELLTDIHLVDGSLYSVPQQRDSLSKHGLGLYLAVFKAHHTDSIQFNKSLKYYTLHPDMMNDIYIGVNRRLESKLDSLGKVKDKTKPDAQAILQARLKRANDSLARVKAQLKIDSTQKAHLKKKTSKKKKTHITVNAVPEK